MGTISIERGEWAPSQSREDNGHHLSRERIMGTISSREGNGHHLSRERIMGTISVERREDNRHHLSSSLCLPKWIKESPSCFDLMKPLKWSLTYLNQHHLQKTGLIYQAIHIPQSLDFLYQGSIPSIPNNKNWANPMSESGTSLTANVKILRRNSRLIGLVYCRGRLLEVGAASLLLANLEKEKELLRIFLRVSQMENSVLRRMNLNSFLMVPVQRVTKYPLLLARLYRVTPGHLKSREALRMAQTKIELHLEHINSLAKDISTTKLWRRISIINGRRSSSETDMINIKLRKVAVDVLEWNHDEVRFAMEGKLLYTQPTDNNWRRGRTIKLSPVNAMLVTLGKPTEDYQPDSDEILAFPRKNGIRDATLLLVREKSGRYGLLRTTCATCGTRRSSHEPSCTTCGARPTLQQRVMYHPWYTNNAFSNGSLKLTFS
ncbi:hypothetical protein J6590_026301 [Homalodisca vitripennis]|nr:hypothetical protein J6590_026301 [Homalodisca vitripennis]